MAEKQKASISDQELYHKVLLIFSVGQWLAATIMFGLTSVGLTTVTILAVIGAVLMALSHWQWDKRAARIIGRGISYLLLTGFVAATGAIFLMPGEMLPERQWQLTQHALLIVHTVLLVLLPGMALAARKERMWDVSALRIVASLNTVLAAALYLIPSMVERLEMGVDNLYFRLFCVVCMAVTAVTSFLIPPLWRVGKKADK